MIDYTKHTTEKLNEMKNRFSKNRDAMESTEEFYSENQQNLNDAISRINSELKKRGR